MIVLRPRTVIIKVLSNLKLKVKARTADEAVHDHVRGEAFDLGEDLLDFGCDGGERSRVCLVAGVLATPFTADTIEAVEG